MEDERRTRRHDGVARWSVGARSHSGVLLLPTAYGRVGRDRTRYETPLAARDALALVRLAWHEVTERRRLVVLPEEAADLLRRWMAWSAWSAGQHARRDGLPLLAGMGMGAPRAIRPFGRVLALGLAAEEGAHGARLYVAAEAILAVAAEPLLGALLAGTLREAAAALTSTREAHEPTHEKRPGALLFLDGGGYTLRTYRTG